MIIEQTTAPQYLPVTLAEAKAQCRVRTTAEDDLFTGVWIPAAVQACQQALGRSLMAQAWQLSLYCFEDCVRLPWPSVKEVTAVQYLDLAGSLQTLDPGVYEVAGDGVHLAQWKYWPPTRRSPRAVRISYTAGYSDGDETAQRAAVPPNVKAWILLAIGTLYANRESLVDGAQVFALPDNFAAGLLDGQRAYV